MNQKQNEAQAPKNPEAAGGKKKHHKHKGGGQAPRQPKNTKPAQPGSGQQSLQDLASLVRMVPRTNKKPAHAVRAPLPNLMKYKGDGVDHINVSTEAKTELGKLLCSSAYLPFNHPVLGKFSSIMAFNHYIVSAERDDRMRNASPKDLRLLADAGTRVTVHSLWTLIFYATWIQVNAYPALVEALKTNELPFDLYKQKSFRGMPVTLYRPDLHDVSLEIIEAIAKAIKTKKPPVFRSADMSKMIRLTEEFAVLGMAKTDTNPVAEQTAALLKGADVKAIGQDIDRIHEQVVDPAANGFADITLIEVKEGGGVDYLLSKNGYEWNRKSLQELVAELYLNNNNRVVVQIEGQQYQLLEQYFCHTVKVGDSDVRFLHEDRAVVEKFNDEDGANLSVIELHGIPDQPYFAALLHKLTNDVFIAQQLPVAVEVTAEVAEQPQS